MRLFIIFFTISSITGFTQYAVNKTDPKLKVVYQPEPKLVNQETLINNYLKEIFGNVNSPKENQQDIKTAINYLQNILNKRYSIAMNPNEEINYSNENYKIFKKEEKKAKIKEQKIIETKDTNKSVNTDIKKKLIIADKTSIVKKVNETYLSANVNQVTNNEKNNYQNKDLYSEKIKFIDNEKQARVKKINEEM
jgi:hypothetical protein